jgi:uncharacterized protein YqgV (UPF0045/DUF77 family)
MRARAEFTVEPFVDGQPGPHVVAAVDAVRRMGFDPAVGPFATSFAGPADTVVAAVTALLTAARDAGANRVSLQIEFDG